MHLNSLTPVRISGTPRSFLNLGSRCPTSIEAVVIGGDLDSPLPTLRVGLVSMNRSRPSSWWRFETEAEALRVQRRWWKVIDGRRVAGARSTAWRIVLRPERRYQALRLRRTAARLRGLTAAHRPSFWHPCRSTAQ